MDDSISKTDLVVVEVEGENRMDSRLIANKLGIEHEAFMRTLRKYQTKLETLGLVRFENGSVKNKGARGTKHIVYAMLNENQATFAATLSRNTDEVVEFKLALTIAFSNARETLNGANARPFLNTLWTRRALIFNEKTRIPDGYWCIFNEIGHICWQMELKDVHLTEESTPDISVGQLWAKHARSTGKDMSLAKKYNHHYPPGDKRGVQQAYIYPNDWYGDFRTWFQIQYLKVEFKKYLATHMQANGELPAPKPRQIKGQ